MASNADFTIDGDAFANAGYDAVASATVNLQLEDSPALDVRSTNYRVIAKSSGAGTIPELGDPGAGGASPTPNPQDVLPITMPAGTGSWLIQCQINGGKGFNGTKFVDEPSFTKQRIIAIREANGNRHIVPSESTQYDGTYGWTEAVSGIVTAGGGATASTVSALPSAAGNTGALYYATDASFPGPCVVVSDGAKWIRTDTLEAVQAHGDVETQSLSLGGTWMIRTLETSDTSWFTNHFNSDVPFTFEAVYYRTAGNMLIGATSATSGIAWQVNGHQHFLRILQAVATNELFINTTNVFTNDVWHHAFVHYPGTMSPDDVIFVVDGVEQGKDAAITDTLSTRYTSGGRLGLAGLGSFNDNRLTGRLHRVRAWSGKTVTAAQMIAASVAPAVALDAGDLHMFYRCGNGVDHASTAGNVGFHNYALPGKIGSETSGPETSALMVPTNTATLITDAP